MGLQFYSLIGKLSAGNAGIYVQKGVPICLLEWCELALWATMAAVLSPLVDSLQKEPPPFIYLPLSNQPPSGLPASECL